MLSPTATEREPSSVSAATASASQPSPAGPSGARCARRARSPAKRWKTPGIPRLRTEEYSRRPAGCPCGAMTRTTPASHSSIAACAVTTPCRSGRARSPSTRYPSRNIRTATPENPPYRGVTASVSTGRQELPRTERSTSTSSFPAAQSSTFASPQRGATTKRWDATSRRGFRGLRHPSPSKSSSRSSSMS